MVDKQSSQTVADNPRTVIPRAEAANCVLGALSGGQNGGIRWKMDAGDSAKPIPRQSTRRRRLLSKSSFSCSP